MSTLELENIKHSDNANNNIALASNGSIIVDRRSSDGEIVQFHKDGADVGRISTWSSNIAVGRINCALLFDDDTNRIKPASVQSNAARDNVIDLGDPSHRFNDIWIGGGIHLGGTGSASKLDDYEEGEWTPGWVGTSGGSWTSRTGYTKGYYTKIGRLVNVTVRFETISRGSPSGYLQMTGLPFTNLSYTANVANQVYKVILLRGNTAVTDSIGVFARLTGNASSVQFYTRRTNSTYSFDQLDVGSVTGNFEGGFEFSYVTS